MKSALQGLKVVECATVVAAPLCGRLLADFGAQVLHVEHPQKGDPLRDFGFTKDGINPWWKYYGRNKKYITLDISKPKGKELLYQLLSDADVFIENFRPGKLEEWGIHFEDLQKINPRLVMVRISGYGQTGPYSQQPGFGTIAEAMSGFAEMTGEVDGNPTLPQFPLADTCAGFYAAMSAMFAIYHRDSVGAGKGQVIDVALTEAVLNVMESLIPEYSAFGEVREPAGSALPGIAPSNAYPCSDGVVLIAGNGDSIVKRLMATMGRPNLAQDPELADNAGRVKRVAEIDAAIGQWTQAQTVDVVLARLAEAKVPAGRVYTARDIVNDPHYQAREMILKQATRDGHEVHVPGIVPKLLGTPGRVRSSAPRLGDDTDAVLAELGLSAAQIGQLRDNKVVS